ncbi:MAG: murein biosynthesis integral membrane protein MurJ [Trueperaceae bacterium]|nr:murein biosynthesis integral membrane protein MurJ [Trueperaceae bacterium]
MTPRSDAPAPRPRRSAGRGAAVLMGGTLGSRVTGLLRNSLLNQLFDRTITDAFAVAVRVPNLFRELLAEGALTNSFVPVYARLAPADARRLSAALFSLLILVNGLLVLAATLAAPWLVALLLGGEGSVDAALAVRLTRAVFPFLMAVSLSAWAMGVLNAEERFLAPAWAPVALNLVAVGGMLAFPGAAIPLAAAFALGGAAQFLVQVPFLVRAGLWPGLGRPWHPELAGVLLLMAPFAVTTSGRQIVNVVATRVLNGLPSGSQTAWFNADLFLSLGVGLFAVSPALSWYARLSRLAGEDPDAFAPTLRDGLRFITVLSAPAGLLLAVLAEPAVRVTFDWLSLVGGGLDAERLRLTVAATPGIGLAVLPLGLHQLLTRAWYVRRRVRTPILVAVGFLSAQGVAFAVLGPMLGVAGLAWGSALAAWLQLAVMLTLTARQEGLALRPLLAHGGRVLLAALLAAAVAWAVAGLVPTPHWFAWAGRLMAGGTAGLATYALAVWALGLPEARAVRDRFAPPRDRGPR